MKTGIKLLIVTAGLAVALLITGMVIMRSDVSKIMSDIKSEFQYEEIAVGPFKGLDFTGNWIVVIRQSREYKVEWTANEENQQSPILTNENGTLYFDSNEQDSLSIGKTRMARITAPVIEEIKTEGPVRIRLRGFESDTLNVVLTDGGALTGHNSHFNNLSMHTSGDAWFEFTDDTDHEH